MKATIAAAAIGSMLSLAWGYCCGGDGSGICGDGTKQGAGCYGYGSCNIFCCNCDPQGGTCRGGRSDKRSSFPDVFKRADIGTEWAFSEADKSGNGSISLPDYLEYMGIALDNTEILLHWETWFKQHDTNGDGRVSLDEAE